MEKKNHAAKLNWKKVFDIRKRYGLGELQSKLAREYNVTISTILSVVQNRTWANIKKQPSVICLEKEGLPFI